MKKVFVAAIGLLLGLMLYPAMALAQSDAVAPNAQPSHGSPTCIESDIVQNAPEAAALSRGNDFRNGPSHYLIITDGGTCRFFCSASSVLKCAPENRCADGIDLTKVAGIKACLAAHAEAAAPPDTLPLLAAAPDAAAPVAAAPAASTSTGLAVTGAESAVLAILGTALIAFGAGAMATHTRIKSN